MSASDDHPVVEGGRPALAAVAGPDADGLRDARDRVAEAEGLVGGEARQPHASRGARRRGVRARIVGVVSWPRSAEEGVGGPGVEPRRDDGGSRTVSGRQQRVPQCVDAGAGHGRPEERGGAGDERGRDAGAGPGRHAVGRRQARDAIAGRRQAAAGRCRGRSWNTRTASPPSCRPRPAPPTDDVSAPIRRRCRRCRRRPRRASRGARRGRARWSGPPSRRRRPASTRR